MREKFLERLTPIYGEREAMSLWQYLSDYPSSKFSLEEIILKLEEHYPIQYITNISNFYGYDYYVDESVLIPRPETEELVHWILQDTQGISGLHLLDIGTGSGCIICTLGKKLNAASLYAIDIEESALAVAQKNAQKHNLQLESELTSMIAMPKPWEGKMDIIVSNPPYIAESESGAMTSNTMYEPNVALYGPGEDGLDYYRWMAAYAAAYLSARGQLYLELNALAADKIASLFSEFHWKTELKKDLQGMWRMMKCSRS